MRISDPFTKALDFLRLRKRAYQLTFKTMAGQEVLKDLELFCRARETCVIPGDRDRTLILEGRREVWLRIANHLNLSSEELYLISNGGSVNFAAPQPKGEDDDV